MGAFIHPLLWAFSLPTLFLTCVCTIHVCACVCGHVYVSVWRPQLNSGSLSSLLSTIIFETGFHTEPRAQMIEWQAPEGLLSLPALCWYSRHVSTFWWVLELELRSSCLHDQHFTNEPLLQFL